MSNLEIYSEAKRLLNASAPDRVVCRQKETAELDQYLMKCFDENKTMSLYVNGQPGTGKTLTINHILENFKEEFDFKHIYINCMSLKNIQALYKSIIQELSSANPMFSDENVYSTPTKRTTRSSAAKLVEQPLTPSKRGTKENLCKQAEVAILSTKQHIVLVLDEIDQIEVSIKSPADLYKIFEWPFLPGSKFILIGIANSLDFTERILPRLEMKPECKPKIVNFTPYTKEDIVNIIKDRLKMVCKGEENYVIIEDKALNLCATKIASSNGDIRKVLDICRRAIEVIEQEAKFNKENSTAIKPVGILQMMKIFNEVNPMNNAKFDRGSMPLTQKFLLCTILLCTKEMKVKEIPLSKLFERFNKLCDTKIESESEFINLCCLVQDNGLIDVKKGKEVRNYKVSLRIDEQELRDKLEDEVFIGNILAMNS